MNMTNLIHCAWALGFMIAVGLATGNWWAGAAFGSAFFLGRELAQAEMRWLKLYKKDYDEMPELACLDPVVWKNQTDALLDWILPTACCLALALVMQYYSCFFTLPWQS